MINTQDNFKDFINFIKKEILKNEDLKYTIEKSLFDNGLEYTLEFFLDESIESCLNLKISNTGSNTIKDIENKELRTVKELLLNAFSYEIRQYQKETLESILNANTTRQTKRIKI